MAIKHTKTAIPDVDKVDCTDWNANHTGTLNHQTELTNVTSDQHHPQTHTIASHDTTATGTELNTLTNNSIANTLHRHSELVASDGAPDPALSVDATGKVGIKTVTPDKTLSVAGDGVSAIFGQDITTGQHAIIVIGQEDAADKSGNIDYDLNNNYMTLQIGGDAVGSSLVITNGGNVGIDTTTPAQRFVAGTGTTAGLDPKTYIVATNDADVRMGACVNNQLTALQSTGSNYGGLFAYDYGAPAPLPLVLNYFGGNVGIGPDISPDYKLDVQGTFHADGLASFGGNVNVSGGRVYDETGFVQPVGAMTMFGGAAAPDGWVLCNGASLLRAGTYADLFAVIGVTFGSADGTHFNVPDMRGIFPRGAGVNGTLSDAGGTAFTGVLGTYQNDKFQSHAHRVSDTTYTIATFRPTGAGAAVGFDRVSNQEGVGQIFGGILLPDSFFGGTAGNPRGGAETNPANLGLTFIIKY